MICSNCKRAVNNHATICPFCGEPLTNRTRVREDVTNDEYTSKIKEHRQQEDTGNNYRTREAASSSYIEKLNRISESIYMDKQNNSKENPYINGDIFSKDEAPAMEDKVFEGEEPLQKDEVTAIRNTRNDVKTQGARSKKDTDYTSEPKKRGAKSFFKGLLIFILLIGAAAAAMFYAYSHLMGNSAKEYSSSISGIKARIEKVNNDGAAIFKNNQGDFSTDDFIKKLPALYNSMDKIIDDCDKVTPPSNYAQQHNNLKEGLKYNRLLYRQLETVVKTPLNPDEQKNADQFYQYVKQCTDSYSKFSLGGASISLPAEIEGLPKKLDPWIKQKQKDYSEISSMMESFTKYFENMSALLVEYDSSKVDMSQALAKTKTDNPSWDGLLPLIDKNTQAVNNIKIKYIKLSVPSYLRTFNKRLGPIIDEMLSYYSKLKAATKADMNFGKKPMSSDEATKKSDEIKALYQEADKLNNSATTDYQKFTSDIESEKNKYLNPDYVMQLKSGKK